MEVDGTTISLVPESCSPSGSSQTLPTIKPSDDSDGDTGSEHSTSANSNSSPDCDSDHDPDSHTKKKPVQEGKPQKVKVARKLDGRNAVSKRRRTDETGSSVVTSIVQQPKASKLHQKGNGRGKPRKISTPFSRIKVDEVQFADERLKDNTFGSRKAAANDYGAKANSDLIVTKGASFRKEKNKKKRGSYRGGEITVRQAMTGATVSLISCLI